MKCHPDLPTFYGPGALRTSFTYDYINDILVTRATKKDHLEHLLEVCHCLAANGIVMNPNKCVLGTESLEFLGHQVDRHGIWPLEEKVDAVCHFPRPTSQRKLHQYLSQISWF